MLVTSPGFWLARQQNYNHKSPYVEDGFVLPGSDETGPSCVSGFTDNCGFLVCLRTRFPAVISFQIFGCTLMSMRSTTDALGFIDESEYMSLHNLRFKDRLLCLLVKYLCRSTTQCIWEQPEALEVFFLQSHADRLEAPGPKRRRKAFPDTEFYNVCWAGPWDAEAALTY
jgi:hypothetical protein